MKSKRIFAIVSICILLCACIFALTYGWSSVPGTYEESVITDVSKLQQDPSDYDVSEANGIAEIIVKENLDKTNAMNDVASIVFDFRGFDTLGESFILLTAIAGSFVILSVVKKSKKKEDSGK